MTSLRLTPEEASEYNSMRAKLEAHFVVRRNVIFERAKFNQRHQEVGESAEGFITALHCLAEHCGYGALHSEMNRDRLVVGLRDKKLSEQLQMDPDLTLEKAVTKVRQSEQVKKQQDMLKNNFKAEVSSEVDAVSVSGKYRQQRAKVPAQRSREHAQCGRCGREAHSVQQCPARDATCNSCKKRGHFAKVCKSNTISEINTADIESEEDVAFLGSVNANDSGAPWLIKLRMADTETEFKIDTGADVTVIPASMYSTKHFGGLEKTEKILLGPGQTRLPVEGKFSTTLCKGRMPSHSLFPLQGAYHFPYCPK